MRALLFGLFFGYVITSNIVFSQGQISSLLNDTLNFEIDEYRGELIWQESIEIENWNFLSAGNPAQIIISDTISRWIRARIIEENCAPFYDANFQLNAVDTSDSGHLPKTFIVEELNAELVSVMNDVFIFGGITGSFPVKAGDYLSGIIGQPHLLFVKTVIFNQGVAKVYTQETELSVYSIKLNFGNSISSKIQGRVFDEGGNPIAFAKVIIGDTIRLTDINGVFIFESAVVNQKAGFVKVIKSGYFDGFRLFVPKSGGNNVDLQLIAKIAAVNYVFQSSSGLSIDYEGYLGLNFPPNAYSLNGLPYSGRVRLFYKHIHPESDQFYSEMPGSLIGSQFGNTRGLKSFGMLAIEITDTLGQELQIISGNTVTTSFPIGESLLLNAPDTIDLWSFNEDFGYWEDEGQAFKEGNAYIAELPHFSFWNCDDPWDLVYLNGTVTDQSGNPVSDVIVNLSNPLVGNGKDETNSQGEFGGIIPRNVLLNLSVDFKCEDSQILNLQNGSSIGPLHNDTVYNIQNISLQQIKKVFGSAEYCDIGPISNGYALSSGQITFIQDGEFTFNTCLDEDSIRIVNSNPFELGEWQNLSLEEAENDIGLISLCDGIVIETGELQDIDENDYITVKIGEQWWMTQGLRTTRFSDGTPIPYLRMDGDWANTLSPACCDLVNNPLRSEINGKLYNWFTASDPANVCPVGWHVPTNQDWNSLSEFLGGDEVAGGKLKALSGWQLPNNGATNETGFSAVPTGFRGALYGSFNTSFIGYYWTSEEFDNEKGWQRTLYSSGTNVSGYGELKRMGIGIRCIKD